MFTSRIPLPKNPNEAIIQAKTKAKWLPRQSGHTGLKFSKGLEMSHNDASRACEDFVKNARVDAKFTSSGVEIRTDGEYSPKAILAILEDVRNRKCGFDHKGTLGRITGQTVKFSNGTAVSHSESSKACQNYVNKVASGKIVIPGMTAVFESDGTKIEGIQRHARKTVAKLRG